MVYLFYTSYISVDLAHHKIFHAKIGKGGIMERPAATRTRQIFPTSK